MGQDSPIGQPVTFTSQVLLDLAQTLDVSTLIVTGQVHFLLPGAPVIHRPVVNAWVHKLGVPIDVVAGTSDPAVPLLGRLY